MKKTKKIKAKKPLKKTPKKREARQIVEVRVRAEQPVPQTTAIVPVTPITPKDIEPIKAGGKYMIPKTWVTERQALAILQKTPDKYVQQRPAKGGGSWSFVPGWYVQKVLNFVFGWNWDFEIVQAPTVAEVMILIDKGIDQIWVIGKLTVKDDNGHTISKSQTGRADIKFRKASTKSLREPLDIGNDMKAANTDALKKCASLFGIASDVYSKQESKSEGYHVAETNNVKPVENVITPIASVVNHECFEGAEPISQAEYEYSKKLYGKPLCREHQKSAKRK